MREVAAIDEVERARVLLNPIRIRLVHLLREPRTCNELADALDMTPQRVGNHLKALRDAGLVSIVRTRRVRNLLEATYQAEAKGFWLSPRLMRPDDLSDAEMRDRVSLHNLLATAQEVHEDVVRLLERAEDQEVPSLGLAVEVSLSSQDERERFTRDVLAALRPVVERYQGTGASATAYRLQLVCYPKPEDERR